MDNMSYYAGFNIEKDQFILFNNTTSDLYIGSQKIKNLYIKYDFNKFKNENISIFEINEKNFNELGKMNQYYVVDNIKNRNLEFLSKYNLEEWII
jgi:hypothetical protein